MDIGLLARRDSLPILRLPFPGLEALLRRTFPVFEEAVCSYFSLSREDRLGCGITEPEKKELDLGFIEKSRAQGGDDKVYFHYRPSVKQDLRDPRFARLLECCDELYGQALNQALRVVAVIEFSDPRFQGLTRKVKSYPGHRLRLLWYKHGSGMLARKHPDDTFLTNHLGETHGGLQVECQGVLCPVVVYPDQSLFFSGRKAPLATEGWIPDAVEHAVIREEVIEERRMAAVFFLHGPWKLPDTEH